MYMQVCFKFNNSMSQSQLFYIAYTAYTKTFLKFSFLKYFVKLLPNIALLTKSGGAVLKT